MKRPDGTTVLVVSLLLAGAGTAGLFVRRLATPSPLVWESISTPIVLPEKLVVTAEATRRNVGCQNGAPSMDMRSKGVDVRLKAPSREIVDSLSTYESDLDDPIPPGFHEVRVRETFICDGAVKPIESQWIRFEVKP
jgi:hypothetical protein